MEEEEEQEKEEEEEVEEEKRREKVPQGRQLVVSVDDDKARLDQLALASRAPI